MCKLFIWIARQGRLKRRLGRYLCPQYGCQRCEVVSADAFALITASQRDHPLNAELVDWKAAIIDIVVRTFGAAMIHYLSATLQNILDDPALHTTFPELCEAEIVFDRPTESFSPEKPTIDLFLYDIRENMELRSNEPTIKRLNGQAEIQRPPLRVACSYLVTAWPGSGTGAELALKEHQLLGQVLQVLSRYPKIPNHFLHEQLAGQEPPLPMMIVQADGLKEPAEFWTAIGNKLRPSLTVTVTISMEVVPPVPPPPSYIVTTGVVRLGERIAPNAEAISPPTQQTFFWIGGQVTRADNVPVEGATVTLVEPGLVAQTGADGNYTLGSIPEGSYTLRVQSGTTTRDVTVTVPAPERNHYNVQIEATS